MMTASNRWDVPRTGRNRRLADLAQAAEHRTNERARNGAIRRALRNANLEPNEAVEEARAMRCDLLRAAARLRSSDNAGTMLAAARRMSRLITALRRLRTA